jgi:ribosomal protein S18 acetylase RimI-like enzyme
MTITIRALLLSDEPFLWEMLYQALYVPEGQPPFPREIIKAPEISRYVAGWGRAGDVGYLALDGARPVGAVWLRLWSDVEHGYGYVDRDIPELSVAILPEYRGQGIGGGLIRHLLAENAGHFCGVSLSVSAENPARQLYQRLGFEVLGEENSSIKMLWREKI